MAKIDKHPYGAPSWVDLASTDGAAAKKYYTELFGWSAEDMPMDDTGTNFYTMYSVGGRHVAASFQQPKEMAGMPSFWQTYFNVENADACVERVKAAGGTVMSGPDDVFDSGRMLVCQDPQGGVFMLWQAKQHIGMGLKSEPGSVAWVELMTSDQSGAFDFYEKVLGAKRQVERTPTGMDYGMLGVDGQPVAGVMSRPDQNIPTHWGVYFEVASVDAAVAKSDSLGGGRMFEKMDIDFAWVAGLKDPQGAYFALMETKEQGQS